jgi:hypothetical protein
VGVTDASTDVHQTLRRINTRLEHLEEMAEVHEAMDDESLEGSTARLEKQLSFLQRWGWVFGLAGVLFSAGMGYMMFLGANATDAEVQSVTRKAIIEHNGYVDPRERDPATGIPRGHHPDMRQAIKTNAKATEKLTETQTQQGKSLDKLDKRSRYQFEYTKWEVKKAECKRQRNCTRRDLRKPKALEDLETELIND